MARSPIYSLQTNGIWNEQWLDDGKNPVDLTNPDTSNGTLSLRIMNLDESNPHTGTGTFTPVDMKHGKFKYKWIPGDFLPIGLYVCQYSCLYANGQIGDGDYFQIQMFTSI
jgi:hypothetical protein